MCPQRALEFPVVYMNALLIHVSDHDIVYLGRVGLTNTLPKRVLVRKPIASRFANSFL